MFTVKTALTVVILAALVSLALFFIGNKKRGSDRNIRMLVLVGSPYNRGLIHGQTLKNEIGEVIQLWKKDDIEKRFSVDADSFVSDFLETTDFIPAIRRWTPEILEEVKGISDGSGIDFNTMLVYQFPDEQWRNGGDVIAERCTAVGVNKQGERPTYVAQNMDAAPSYYHRYKVLLHIKHEDSDLESFVFTIPGLIALNGMNNKSIAITCNTLSQLEYARDGLPVTCILRGVLKQNTLKEAEQFIHDVRHACGQFYVVGGPEKALGFECSANKVSQFIPYEGADRTYHTNFPLVNDNYGARYLERLKELNRTVEEGAYYCYRFEALEKRLKDSSKMIDLDTIKSTLSSRDSEKKPISNKWTLGCSIMILSDNPEFHLAPGRPDLTPFTIFRFGDGSRVAEN